LINIGKDIEESSTPPPPSPEMDWKKERKKNEGIKETEGNTKKNEGSIEENIERILKKCNLPMAVEDSKRRRRRKKRKEERKENNIKFVAPVKQWR